MFQELAHPGQRLWLLALLGAWAGFLLGGFALGSPEGQKSRRMPTWTRMASSLTLVGAGGRWYVLVRGPPAGPFSLLVALGMTLGFVGDLFMANWLGVPQPVLGGIGAFGLGHVAYIAAFLLFGNHHGLDAAGPRWGSLVAWLVIGLAGWWVLVYPSFQPAALRVAA